MLKRLIFTGLAITSLAACASAGSTGIPPRIRRRYQRTRESGSGTAPHVRQTVPPAVSRAGGREDRRADPQRRRGRLLGHGRRRKAHYGLDDEALRLERLDSRPVHALQHRPAGNVHPLRDPLKLALSRHALLPKHNWICPLQGATGLSCNLGSPAQRAHSHTDLVLDLRKQLRFRYMARVTRRSCSRRSAGRAASTATCCLPRSDENIPAHITHESTVAPSR